MIETPFVILQTSEQQQLVAIGSHRTLECENTFGALQMLDVFTDQHKGSYIFLSLSYDLKNAIEVLESNNSNPIAERNRRGIRARERTRDRLER